MNKLISKNPVQRFKMGKQIQKLQWGNIVSSQAEYNRKVDRGIIDSKWDMIPIQQKEEIIHNLLTPKSIEETPVTQNNGQNSVKHVTNDKPATVVKSGVSKSVVTKSAPVAKTTITKPAAVTNDNGLKLFNKIGVDRTYTHANDRFANITQGQKDILKTLGISGNNALELQKSINSYLSKNGLGGIAEDNKWGGQSQAALDYILNSTDAGIQAPAALRKENLESVNYSTPVQVAPVVQIPEVIQAPAIQLNRKQTRQRMRDLGLNPYDYTGEQRRALRRFWNGDDSQDISFLRLKNGGLISKNPITRFKQRFV